METVTWHLFAEKHVPGGVCVSGIHAHTHTQTAFSPHLLLFLVHPTRLAGPSVTDRSLSALLSSCIVKTVGVSNRCSQPCVPRRQRSVCPSLPLQRGLLLSISKGWVPFPWPRSWTPRQWASEMLLTPPHSLGVTVQLWASFPACPPILDLVALPSESREPT